MGTPARRYSWPPFEPNNAANLKHGARTPRVWGPLAADLIEWAKEMRPDLAEPRHESALRRWARLEAVALLFAAWFDDPQNHLIGPDGVAPGFIEWERIEVRAANAAARLGLDPVSEAALRKVQTEAVGAAVDLEQLKAHGRAARAARTDEALEGPQSVGGCQESIGIASDGETATEAPEKAHDEDRWQQ